MSFTDETESWNFLRDSTKSVSGASLYLTSMTRPKVPVPTVLLNSKSATEVKGCLPYKLGR